MYYLSLDNQNLHPIVILDVRCVKGVVFYRIVRTNFSNKIFEQNNARQICILLLTCFAMQFYSHSLYESITRTKILLYIKKEIV